MRRPEKILNRRKQRGLPRLLQPWFPSGHRIDSYSRNPRFDSTKRKCRTSTWGCCPAFSRCLAKIELCVTVVFFELWFLSIPKSLRHAQLLQFLCHSELSR